VIDDDVSARDLVGRILAKEGLTPVLSPNAMHGLAMARQLKPALIILDIRMAEPDSGWKALRCIREEPELHNCRVIVLTIDDDFKKGRELGADAHLLKPIDRDALLRSIRDVCPSLAYVESPDTAPVSVPGMAELQLA
jgi:CheY-like chemotaxis protein